MSIVRFTAPAALIAACFCLAADARAADTREARSVEAFRAIAVSAPIRVEITQGDAQAVVVEGDAEALAQLETVVENGALKLRQKTRERVARMDKVKAHVTARDIQSLSVSGSGDMVSAALRTGDLQLSVSGSGNLRIEQLTAAKLDVSVSGSGDVRAAGKADSVIASLAGSGDLKAGKLQVNEARVAISGSGAATLWARDKLSARIAGSGDLRYYGDPAVQKSVAGSGSIKRVGATPS